MSTFPELDSHTPNVWDDGSDQDVETLPSWRIFHGFSSLNVSDATLLDTSTEWQSPPGSSATSESSRGDVNVDATEFSQRKDTGEEANEVAALHSRIEELEATLEVMRVEHADCVKPADYRTKFEETTAKLDHTTRRGQELQKRVEGLEALNKSMSEALLVNEQLVQNLQAVDTKNRQIKAIQEAEMEQLKQERTLQADALELRIHALEDLVDSLSGELDLERSQAASLRDDVEAMDAKIQEKEVRIRVLEASLSGKANVESALQELRLERENLTRQLDLAAMRFNMLELRFTEVQKREEALKKQKLNVEDMLLDARRTVVAQMSQIKELQATIAELRKPRRSERSEGARANPTTNEREDAEQKRRMEEERQAHEEQRRERGWKDATEREQVRCQVRDMKWKSGRWSPKRAVTRFQEISKEFLETKFSREMPLTALSVPWPILASPGKLLGVDTITWNDVEAFFFAIQGILEPEEYSDLLGETQRMMHPDRWKSRQLLDSVQDPNMRSKLEKAGNIVAQAVTAVRNQTK